MEDALRYYCLVEIKIQPLQQSYYCFFIKVHLVILWILINLEEFVISSD